MRTIDPAIILAAMATIETPPVPLAPLPPREATGVRSRTRRTTFAPVTPKAVVYSRCA